MHSIYCSAETYNGIRLSSVLCLYTLVVQHVVMDDGHSGQYLLTYMLPTFDILTLVIQIATHDVFCSYAFMQLQ